MMVKNPLKFLDKVKHRLGIPSSDVRKMILRNKEVWSNYKNTKAKSVILFDYYPLVETELVRGYLWNVLAEKHNARIVSYATDRKIYSKIWHKIYESMNVSEHILVSPSSKQKKKRDEIYNNIIGKITTKQELFDLHIHGVWIGIDIYEEYLMRCSMHTVTLEDARIKDIIKDAIDILLFFEDYFQKNNVKVIDSSHIGVRLKSNLVPKIAGKLFNIPFYTSHSRSVIHYPKPHLYYEEEERIFSSYHNLFLKQSAVERAQGVLWAKNSLSKRLSGGIGVDGFYATKTSFGKVDSSIVVTKNSNKLKIVICPHEFYDSPNCSGGLLFLDFYEWLLYLAHISTKTDFDWYIKTHPDVSKTSEIVIKDFVEKNQQFTLIPSKTSFHQLKNEGVSHVLTCFGSVGHECPLIGMTVINAGNNVHMAYDFNHHPKTLDEYEKILLNLGGSNEEININDIYEFYYVQHKIVGRLSDDWFFDSYDKMLLDLSVSERNGFEMFRYFLENITPEKHERIILTMKKFIDSQKVGVAMKEVVS